MAMIIEQEDLNQWVRCRSYIIQYHSAFRHLDCVVQGVLTLFQVQGVLTLFQTWLNIANGQVINRILIFFPNTEHDVSEHWTDARMIVTNHVIKYEYINISTHFRSYVNGADDIVHLKLSHTNVTFPISLERQYRVLHAHHRDVAKMYAIYISL